MKVPTLLTIVAIAISPTAVGAQTGTPDLAGTWRAETPDGPQTIIVRADSSASWGDETVRWRLQADSIFIALGDEWYVYNYHRAGRQLTLSGGDLVDPVTLELTGPPTPRPDGIPLPPAPPMTRRADIW